MGQRQFPEFDRMYRDVKIAETVLRDLLTEVETLLNYHKRL